jgi:serine/threonine-protein kinase RsbT
LHVHKKPIFEGSYTIQGGNFDEAGKVSSQIKFTLKKLGLPMDVVRRAALVTYESEINKGTHLKMIIQRDVAP